MQDHRILSIVSSCCLPFFVALLIQPPLYNCIGGHGVNVRAHRGNTVFFVTPCVGLLPSRCGNFFNTVRIVRRMSRLLGAISASNSSDWSLTTGTFCKAARMTLPLPGLKIQ